MDWTDLESFSRPPPRGTSDCADPEASWGHRKNNLRHDEDELFFGYYLSAAIMVPDEQGPPVPELARRMTLSSCRHDPVPAFTPVLTAMPAAGIPLGDVLADSGYAHRVPGNWAAPLRRAGAALIQDLHPHDRGPRGTHQGAIIANGNLYCPARPAPCWNSGRSPAPPPPSRPRRTTRRPPRPPATSSAASPATTKTATTASQCPAAAGKIRCPLRPAVDDPGPGPPRDPRPAGAPAGLLHPADHHHPGRTCSPRPRRSTTTPPPPGAAPTPAAAAPSAASPPPRTPPATTSARGWCRLMGLAPLMLFTTALLVVRNQRILAAWNARQEENARRAARGLPPKTRKRRRKTPAALPPPRRPDSHPRTRATATITSTTQREHARTRQQQPEQQKRAPTAPLNQPCQAGPPSRPKIRPKRELSPH